MNWENRLDNVIIAKKYTGILQKNLGKYDSADITYLQWPT